MKKLTRDFITSLENGGCTYNNNGTSYNGNGYAVGIYGTTFDNIGQITENEIFKTFEKARAMGLKVGGWVNTDTDIIYIDLVQVYNNKQEAIKEAESLGELAIYDFEKKEEIKIVKNNI